MHPVSGADHIAAMLAVGLWSAHLGRFAILLLPAVFLLVMAVSGFAGAAGITLPAIEIGIALSAVTIGSLVAFAVRLPLALAAAVVGFFAIFHGYAHGAEIPDSAGPLLYGAGFLLMSGCLQLAGVAAGRGVMAPMATVLTRTGGGLIAIAGLGFLGSAL
tara:strand:- start:32725 stop:33204 length:480 start_codon:yes stop_codon:yes gene_type:complete